MLTRNSLGMFAYVSVEARVPSEHPIRKLRVLVDTILGELDGVLTERYARGGWPSGRIWSPLNQE